jgi:methyl-accepting chemotaxis protein
VELTCGYALSLGESASVEYEFGEGLIGQAAAEGRTLYVDDIPDGYIKIISGLGSASPRYLLIVPVKNQNEVLGVMEMAAFTDISEDKRKFVEEAAQLLVKNVAK